MQYIEIWLSEWACIPKVLLWVCSLLLLFTLPYVAYMVCYVIKGFLRKKKSKTDFLCKSCMANMVIMLIFLLGIAYLPFCCFNYGNTTFGSLIEKKHYIENFYVYATNNNRSTKRYKLRATIEKTSHSITEDYYFLKRVYWESGGYLDFSTDGYLGERIYPYKETRVTDRYGDEYYITLTNEKASSVIEKSVKNQATSSGTVKSTASNTSSAKTGGIFSNAVKSGKAEELRKQIEERKE